MHYDPRTDASPLPYDVFKSCTVPRPIGWLSTTSKSGIDNLAPFSQWQNLTFDPPLVMFAANQHPDGRRKDTVLNAEETGYFDLSVNPDLTIHIPERLTDPDLQDRMAKVLVPPPVAKSDEILAESGGMFYPRETPEAEVYVKEGDHFDAGDPLFIIEVMKMFNKVYAPFAGTVDEVLVKEDGVIIKKGQPIFKITPDERIVVESPEEIAARRRDATR